MSTYLYVRCLSHNPPLVSEEESGQHTYDLEQIRVDLAMDRDELLRRLREGLLTYFSRDTARFISHHKGCPVDIIDEYGCAYPAVKDETKETDGSYV